MMEPDPLYVASGLYPRFFRPPYLVRNFCVPTGPSLAMIRKIDADRTYHQSSFEGKRSLKWPVFTNLLHAGGLTAFSFLSSCAAVVIKACASTSSILVIVRLRKGGLYKD